MNALNDNHPAQNEQCAHKLTQDTRISLLKPVTQSDLTRQERLIIWIRRARITQADIARALGMGKPAVGRLLFAERASSWRVQQLRDYGIPEDLLPRAEDIPSGPRPKWANADAAHA